MVTTEKMLRNEEERKAIQMGCWLANQHVIFLLLWSLGLFLVVVFILIPMEIVLFTRFRILPKLRRIRF